MKQVPILFTFDDKLVLPACVCISSLLMSAAKDTFYDVFIIHSDKYDFTNTPLMRLTEFFSNCRLTFRPIGGEFLGAYEIRGIPETCYYRMLAPELIPEYDKLLYSDVDVIFREDLSSYYDIDLGNNYFAAVDNCSRLRPDVREYLKKELDLDWHDGYYYSGNLVINSALIREDGLTAKFRELGKNNYHQQDMDIINIACNKHFLRLTPSFCLTNFLYELIVNRRDEMEEEFSQEELDHALNSGIVHYNGAKPWNTWCHHFDVWWEYYRRSPFFDHQFYLQFYQSKFDEFDTLTLWKRIKILLRFFLVGRKKLAVESK